MVPKTLDEYKEWWKSVRNGLFEWFGKEAVQTYIKNLVEQFGVSAEQAKYVFGEDFNTE